MTNRAWLTVTVFATALGAVGFVVFLSLDPNSYFFYTPEARAAWTFSPGHVAMVCGIVVAEAAIWGAAFISTRPKYLWLRSVLALILLVPWGLFTVQIVMHALRAFPSSVALASHFVAYGCCYSVRHNAHRHFHEEEVCGRLAVLLVVVFVVHHLRW